MDITQSISETLYSLSMYPISLSIAIFLTTFLLEDLATTTGALMASQNIIPVEYVLTALLCGIILGDLFLYTIGKASRRFTWIQKFTQKHSIQKIRSFIQDHLIQSTILARFIPGMRLPTYTAMGMFNLNVKIFFLTVIMAVSAWTIFLFTIIYKLGETAMDLIGTYQLIGFAAIASVTLIISFLSGRVARRILKDKTQND